MASISLLEMEMNEIVLRLRDSLCLLGALSGGGSIEGVIVVENEDVVFGLGLLTLVASLCRSLGLIFTGCHLRKKFINI